MAIEGTTFTVAGTSDDPVCDYCGKTNLTRAVMVRNECGVEFNVGCICASKVLRQRYLLRDTTHTTSETILSCPGTLKVICVPSQTPPTPCAHPIGKRQHSSQWPGQKLYSTSLIYKSRLGCMPTIFHIQTAFHPASAVQSCRP